MFRIGDFSQLGQVSIRTLRLYDEMGLLKPAQIDKFTGYRYYSIEQLPRLNRILALKDLGLSLDQIGDLLKRDLPPDQLRGMLVLKQAEIAQELRSMQAQMRRVEARLKQIEREGRPQYEVVLKSVEGQTIASCRRLVPGLDVMVDYRCEMYRALYRWLEDRAIERLEPELAIYYNTEYVERDIDMELATPIDPTALKDSRALPEAIAVSELPTVEMMASVIHKGDMWDIGQAMVALYSWIGSHGYASAGPYRELHLFWRELEIDDDDFGNIVIEMQIPVRPL